MASFVTIAQVVVLRWTKAERGGPAAVRRSRLPRRDPLCLPEQMLGGWFVHWVHRSAREDYRRRERVEQDAGEGALLKLPCAEIQRRPEGQAEVRYRLNALDGGAPERPSISKTVAVLEPGQWAQIRFNGRFVDEHSWWYKETTLNVAVMARGELGRALLGEPTTTFEDLAQLR